MFVFDAHIDTLSRLITSQETIETATGHVNLEKLVKGKIGAQFFAAFVSPAYYNGLALHRTLAMVDAFWQMLETHAGRLAFAGSGSDILAREKEGKIACLLAVEGGEALEGQLANLRNFYRLGVRLLTLTWNHRNELASGQGEGDAGGGLSRFGFEVVEEMNRLGMLIDVSHLNDPGFWDVIQTSKQPILASHSNARTLCNHPRNLTDEQIKAVADCGGVIGVNFYPNFLVENGKASKAHVIEQINYLVKVGGIECVALGSDFDGIGKTPNGLEDCSKTRVLLEELRESGLNQRQVELIAGGNLKRLCKEILG